MLIISTGKLKKIKFPETLRKINFGNDYNQSLHNVILPPKLEILILKEQYDNSIDNIHLSSYLRYLDLGANF